MEEVEEQEEEVAAVGPLKVLAGGKKIKKGRGKAWRRNTKGTETDGLPSQKRGGREGKF